MTKKESNKRLNAEDRKLSIVEAAMPLFAQKGFHGSTTKEIASAAGISEALLYRHFPSKESLYKEIEQLCCQGCMEKAEEISQLEPSTSTLIMAIYLLVSNIFFGTDEIEDHKNIHRMMAHSLTEDGEFARIFLKNKMEQWLPKFDECFQAAWKEGSLNQEPKDSAQLVWFCHHVAVTLSLMHLPETPVIKHQKDKETMVDDAALFALRGIGLKEDVIKSLYQPKNFKMMLRN